MCNSKEPVREEQLTLPLDKPFVCSNLHKCGKNCKHIKRLAEATQKTDPS